MTAENNLLAYCRNICKAQPKQPLAPTQPQTAEIRQQGYGAPRLWVIMAVGHCGCGSLPFVPGTREVFQSPLSAIIDSLSQELFVQPGAIPSDLLLSSHQLLGDWHQRQRNTELPKSQPYEGVGARGNGLASQACVYRLRVARVSQIHQELPKSKGVAIGIHKGYPALASGTLVWFCKS